MNLAIRMERDKNQGIGPYPVSFTCNRCISQAMPALVKFKVLFYRFPSRRPIVSAVVYIKITSVIIDRHFIIAEARNPSELSIFKKTISASSIGNKREKIPSAQIIYPWEWGLRGSDYVLSMGVIKM